MIPINLEAKTNPFILYQKPREEVRIVKIIR